MKPFYRILTQTALILQSFIILYLLSSHHEDAREHIDECRSNHEATLYQSAGNKLSDLLQFNSDTIKTLLPNIRTQWNRDFVE